MKKKALIITVAAAVLVAAIAGICIYAWQYHNRDHASDLNSDELYQYNYLLTVFGRNNNLTSNSEVLVVDTVTKTLGGDTEVVFRIFRYEKESDLAPALKMTVEQVGENSAYEYMGYGTVTMLDDNFAGMVNMKVIYVK